MKVFIGSSSSDEATQIMQNVAEILEQKPINIIPKRWDDPDMFIAGESVIDNLSRIKKEVDAAIFIYAEDDLLFDGKGFIGLPRDNVLFEHGLFAGYLGIKKSIIIRYKKPKEPSDLKGIVYIDYNEIQKNNLRTRLSTWINSIKDVNTREYCNLHEALKKELAKVEPLKINKKYTNQKELITEFKEKDITDIYYDGYDIAPIKVLCLRGDSFLKVGDNEGDWYPYIFGKNAKSLSAMTDGDTIKKEIIFNGNLEKIVQQRGLQSDDEQYLHKRTMAREMIKEHKECFYAHKLPKLPFRMIFIGDSLFISAFIKGMNLVDSPVMEIHKDSPLYKVCEEYYDKIRKDSKYYIKQ